MNSDAASRLIVLMYHSIAKTDSPREIRYVCSPSRLTDQLCGAADAGYNFVSMKEVEEHLVLGKPLPPYPVSVTFDDGFADNFENALPVLQDLQIPSTVFVVSGTVGGTNSWMTRAGFQERRMVTWPELRAMAKAGMEIGAHTATHPKLTELESDAINQEVVTCRSVLEDKLGQEVRYFAYPFGLFNDDSLRAVQNAKYKLAWSTRSGFVRPNHDKHALRRIEVQGTDTRGSLKRKIRFGTNDGGIALPLRYYSSRILDKAGKILP